MNARDYTWRVYAKTGYLFSKSHTHRPMEGELISALGREFKVVEVSELKEQEYYDVTVR